MYYDKIIIGAGLYGLYSAELCGKKGEKVLVLEYDSGPFQRATYINQARVHMGYHYPRSYSTAIKSADYFDRFNRDYSDCIHSTFEKIYGISSTFSWTSGKQFEKFCRDTKIDYKEIDPKKYFSSKTCDGAFLTKEFTYDAKLLLGKLLNSIGKMKNVTLCYNSRIHSIDKIENDYVLSLSDNQIFTTKYLMNMSYASVNQILKKMDISPFKIKYELCEIILCQVSNTLKNIGITVMDGPFFSIMPFGKTGLHSLTSVTFTPHKTSHDLYPTFECQSRSENTCSPEQLGNCNICPAKPESAWIYMSNLAGKYLRNEYTFNYEKSLYSMKPILKASEIDDSRPTVIKEFSQTPRFISVLSGKINTVYDLQEVL